MTMPPAMFAACLIALAFSVIVFLFNRARYRRWQTTSGTVTELIRRHNHNSSDKGGPTFAPRVSFQTGVGVKIEFVSDVSSYPAPSVGDRVSVR